MAIGSTASSATDGPEPPVAPEPAPAAASGSPDADGPAAAHDPSRRAFFLDLGRQAVTAAGQVAGLADIVGRASGGGVADLLGLGPPPRGGPPPAFVRGGPAGAAGTAGTAPPPAEGRFRSPYRLVGDELVVLDQRVLPESLAEVVARRGSDVAYYLRMGVARGGPIAAQLAAYGLALTAAERTGHAADLRALELRRTSKALTEARPSLRLLGWAMERMLSALAAPPEELEGPEIAQALRVEADRLATDFAAWNAAIAATLADVIGGKDDAPITLLMHGSHGPLHGGVIGAGLPALQHLRDEGRRSRVFLTEGRPFMEGARLAAWELRAAGIEHTIVPDSAVAWLLQREPVDVVLINAEWVTAAGDAGALVGSSGIAQLAAARGVRVILSGVSAIVDPATPDAAAIPDELRPAGDLATYLAGVPVRAGDALVPAGDVVRAADIAVFVSERGVHGPGKAV